MDPVRPGILIGQAVNEGLGDLLVRHGRLHRFDRILTGWSAMLSVVVGRQLNRKYQVVF